MNNILFILYFVIFICFWIIFNQYAKDFKNGFNEYFQIHKPKKIDFEKYRKEINKGKKHIKVENVNNVFDVEQQDLMSHFFDSKNTKDTKDLQSTKTKVNAPSSLDDYFSNTRNKSSLASFF